MNVNIYYGGRGIIEDPTLYVLEKMEAVLDELRVNVTRYNLYDMKNSITTLPQTLKEADGIILAVSVEWLGIGGYMQQFLDACWLYGDKTKMNSLYMCPVVIATTYGEKEALLTLNNAWDLLGGRHCSGISAYVDDNIDFEMNKEYGELIEKKAEDIYRAISHKVKSFPSSSATLRMNLTRGTIDLTPQESEQLSKYVSDDIYVKKQKEDIEELASMFKGMLNQQGADIEEEFVKDFHRKFSPQVDFKAVYKFIITDKNKTLVVDIDNDKLNCLYSNREEFDVLAKLSHEVLENIVRGRITFQRAFMTGEMTAKGNFKTLRMLDQVFTFV